MKPESSIEQRPPFVFWTCLWASGVAFALVAAALDAYWREPGTHLGRDFSNLWVAGKLALAGEAWRAFDPNIFRLALEEYLGVLTLQNYSYPPQALFIAVPFALLPYGWALALWSVAGALFFAWAARPYVRFSPLLAFLTPAAAINLWVGHYGLLLGGLWLLYFRNFDRRPISAGLFAAALTFKPHMGLFIACTALVRRRILIAAILGTLALVAASGFIFGWASWFGFVDSTAAAQAEVLTSRSDAFYFRLMPTAYTAFGRGPVAVVLHLLFAGAAAAMLIRYRRIDPFVLATATFIILPYAFVYDMTVACLGFSIMLWRDWAALSVRDRTIIALAFVSPCLTILFAPLAPPILLAALHVQTRRHRPVSETPSCA